MLTSHTNVSGRRVGGSTVMQTTTTTYSLLVGVDLQQLERRIAERYRDVANELAKNPQFPAGPRLAHVAPGEETPLR